jgi:aminoglycoside/choline kinase family phosphotransferase
VPTEKNTENRLADWCLEQIRRLESEPPSKRSLNNTNISLEALRVEASHRHFYRVRSNGSNRSWVAMRSPPTLENNQQFAVLAQVFQAIGTPQLLASDFERGFFLMEDLGNLHLSDAYESAAGDTLALQRLVESALDALLPLQKIADSAIPPYDEARLIMEFDLCAEWFAESS